MSDGTGKSEGNKSEEQEQQEVSLAFKRFDIYPDATRIFNGEYKSLESVKDDCIFVLDTNVLLFPYITDDAVFEKLQSIYQALTEDSRLCVPGQVAREFASLRPAKLTDAHHQIAQREMPSTFNKHFEIKRYLFLEGEEEYDEFLSTQEAIRDKIKAFNKEIEELTSQYKRLSRQLRKKMEAWYWNDCVSTLYSQLFSEDVIKDIHLDDSVKAQLEDELAERKKYKIPPGYKDSGKTDNAIGDLLIWKTILSIGKEHSQNVVFVTGDAKADWLHAKMYPRFELVHEFQQATNGKFFLHN
jgi:rRNA-processing protein FCF1